MDCEKLKQKKEEKLIVYVRCAYGNILKLEPEDNINRVTNPQPGRE